jgi:RNA polymerase sigma-54 factor
MGMQPRLHARLVQKLILTPSLQQAIKLLPMSTLELAELLNQEMVENPLLEETPTEEAPPPEAQTQTEAAAPEKKADERDKWDDADYEYFFGEYLDDGYRSRQPMEVRELPPIENTLSTRSSLADHLMWQLSLQTADETLKDIGAAIVGNIDNDGMLVASVDEIAALGNWDIALVEKALEHVQGFDPIGVAKLLGVEPEEVKAHMELIRHLDPKPGARYSPSESQYVIPDVYIIKTDEGYRAVLNEDGLPQLRISPTYRRLLDKGGEASDETRAYVKDKFRSALWLLKSVDQRQKTIIKVATSIITFQKDFLDRGIEHLRPLVLRDVANDIGMHESTVSRVVNNKYMHTPQGVYEMKFFFHSGINSSFGEAVSSVTIKQKIKKIIEAEDQRRPLSDSKIMNMLQHEGLVLARRTIAKYREELKIPTSNQRKVLY